MTDDLCTRIAAVLDREIDGFWEPLTVAQAVIRELGLTRRTGQGPYANHVWYQTDWTIE